MTKQLPPNFPESMTGLELINKWGAVAHEAGFKWPDDWQLYIEGTGIWNPAKEHGFFGWNKYRINPERLKPKAPVVLKHPTVKTEGCYVHLLCNYIQLDDRVRRRLSEDAGVDKFKVAEIVTSDIGLHGKTTKIMQLIEAAAVEVNDG